MRYRRPRSGTGTDERSQPVRSLGGACGEPHLVDLAGDAAHIPKCVREPSRYPPPVQEPLARPARPSGGSRRNAERNNAATRWASRRMPVVGHELRGVSEQRVPERGVVSPRARFLNLVSQVRLRRGWRHAGGGDGRDEDSRRPRRRRAIAPRAAAGQVVRAIATWVVIGRHTW